MFGIGLPELILILALALIVVGPDKLPDLARSLAKGLLDLKKTAEELKNSINEEGNPLDEIKPDLEEAAQNFKQNILDDVDNNIPKRVVTLESPLGETDPKPPPTPTQEEAPGGTNSTDSNEKDSRDSSETISTEHQESSGTKK